MAKKKYGSDDDVREDSAYEAGTDSVTDDQATPRGTDPGDGTKYIVVEAGTMIDGIYFPRSDAPAGEEMVVYLPDANAAELVRCGVKLNNEDGSVVEPGEAPDAPLPEGEEGEEIPA